MPTPPAPHGRGAQSGALSRRFNLAEREADGDWLDDAEAIDGPAPKLRTTVTEEHPRAVLTFNKSPDIPFDRSVNAYRGCEHGCIYCFARPTHAYHDLSPGLDFETKLFAKPDAAKILRRTFAKPGYAPEIMAMGTNTDPYQPIEGKYGITREILEVCLEAKHPVAITTKSARVLRDIDLLSELAKQQLVAVSISVTSLDPRLSGILEPRASSPARRVDALARLAAAGVPTHCMISPIIPAITDHHMEAIVDEAATAGVRAANWIMLRLPHEVAPLFREWLDTHFPDRAGKVMAFVQEMRGGRDNDPGFHSRFRPTGAWADLFRQRFALAVKRSGLPQQRLELDCSAFTPPPVDGQLRLL
ncbi:PA0069 family radical SAM protein [Croceicoccus gelatinilyticus]|uniref:PA0069 family radical SAM protein n=1 Tax=Croceicoccus gelatinilyticus TaxID=2835536 RepID=UPI001BCD66BE|nr:PA0069 family radical SAM protein [Croceicoccus gelatinilyticus]MBS7670440.1 PA0069 family radical SAM protein [Croceicoccus gelatinilyticus]